MFGSGAQSFAPYVRQWGWVLGVCVWVWVGRWGCVGLVWEGGWCVCVCELH